MQANTKGPKCECGVTIGLWNIDNVWYCPKCYTPFVRRQALVDAAKACDYFDTRSRINELIAEHDAEVKDDKV